MKLIRGATLIDGLGGLVKNGAVLIGGSRILQVGPESSVVPPEGAHVDVYHYPTHTILPGLIDAHTHLNMPGDGRSGEEAMEDSDGILLLRSAHNARMALESGVTTLRDNGGRNITTFELREGIRQSLTVGPRLVLCGRPVTITGGHCWFMGSEADGVDGVRKAVRRLVGDGADYIKVMTTGGSTRTSFPYFPAFNLDELKALVDEAHKFGRLVAAHTRSTQGIVNCLDSGMDMLIHCTFHKPDGSYSFDPRVAERIAKAGVWVNPTLHIGRTRVWKLEEKEKQHGLTEDEKRRLQTYRADYADRIDACRRLIQMGARMVSGGDTGWSDFAFGQFIYELDSLVEAGLASMQGILSATRDAAQSVGVTDIVGTLEPRKEADVLVVEGDPSRNVRDLLKVTAVFHGGKLVHPAPPAPVKQKATQ